MLYRYLDSVICYLGRYPVFISCPSIYVVKDDHLEFCVDICDDLCLMTNMQEETCFLHPKNGLPVSFLN